MRFALFFVPIFIYKNSLKKQFTQAQGLQHNKPQTRTSSQKAWTMRCSFVHFDWFFSIKSTQTSTYSNTRASTEQPSKTQGNLEQWHLQFSFCPIFIDKNAQNTTFSSTRAWAQQVPQAKERRTSSQKAWTMKFAFVHFCQFLSMKMKTSTQSNTRVSTRRHKPQEGNLEQRDSHCSFCPPFYR